MEKPERVWRGYTPQNSIKEQYTPEGYFCEYPATLTSRWKIHDWEAIRTIYQYLRRIAQIESQYYRKVLYVEYNFVEKPYEMKAMIKDDFSILSQIVIWSQDQAEQEKIKQLFKDWTGIESLYVYIDQQVQVVQERERGAEERARQAQEQARIKEERRKKRALNDPDNPAARKRKARRHLHRLGYDLHITRKTRFDGKGYQIVKLDGGEIIAGENFDLTLYDVERFYMDEDLEREKNCRCDEVVIGHLYNFEPDLEKRERIVREKLEKKHYLLKRTYEKVHYKDDVYIIEKRTRVRKQDKFKKICFNGKYSLSLDDVEKFVAENC